MAYEFNPQSTRFDIPNPHRVENVFVAICAAVTVAAAIALLILSRGMFVDRDYVRFAKSILSALGLLAIAVTYVFLVMRQMRFFFGRGQPADLVPSLQADEQGFRQADDPNRQIADAPALRQTLQQNAISYRVPSGPIDNLLYALVRDLVYSPRLTQTRVRIQFRNLLGIGLLLLLFPISLVGIHSAAAVGWIGCCYFLLLNGLILGPLAGGRISTRRLSTQAVLIFIAAAIVLPVIIATIAPANAFALQRIIDIVPITFMGFAAALIVTGIVFAAGISNTVKPTQINIAPYLETPSVNTTPSQIYTELAREMQRLWKEQVPNRVYMRILPVLSERQGAFAAHVIEETQPIPVDAQRMTFERAFSLATTRWLAVGDIVCTLLTTLGVGLIVLGAKAPSAYTTIAAGGTLVIIAAAGIRWANEFWRRFAFLSQIYWIDCNGNYTRSATKIGTLLTDRVHTERDVVSIESMTLRVWVAEIDSVAFNTDRDRDIVAIRGLPNEAQRLCKLLAEFAKDQSIVTAPTSSVDLMRLDALNALSAATPAPPDSLPGIGSVREITGTAADGKRFCTACGAPAQNSKASFCGACGKRLA
jgi:hypothetical protein